MHEKCTLYNFCIEGGWRCPIFSPVVTWERRRGAGGLVSGAHVAEEGGLSARGICCGCGFTDTSPREWNKKPPALFKAKNKSPVKSYNVCFMEFRRVEGAKTNKKEIKQIITKKLWWEITQFLESHEWENHSAMSLCRKKTFGLLPPPNG